MSNDKNTNQKKDAGDAGGMDLNLGSEAGASGASATKVVSTETQPKSVKRFLIKWSLILVAVLLCSFFLYRAAGTSRYQGTVQRVYEKEAEYRVEFAELSGKVRVIGNSEVRFPYFKTNTADLHAELNRLATTGDIVEIRVWGFRHSWFSMFPNVINVKFVYSAKKRAEEKAEAIADAVMAALANRDALKKQDPGTRKAIVEAVLRASAARNGDLQKKAPAEEE